MRRDRRPLFAPSRRLSPTGPSDEASEESYLLRKPGKPKSVSRREWALFIWAVLTTMIVIILSVVLQRLSARSNDDAYKRHPRPGPAPYPKPEGKRNLIFMVSDGMGPASLSLTRSFRQYHGNLSIDDVLELDKHFIGSSRTRSSSSLVTDSAAGATAFSCGQKSYNGAISMLPDHTPCGTVLEAAKRAGYMTGLVVTTSITDATPACFASHVNLRLEEDLIAQQEVGEHPLGRVLDLMLGGGRCHFLPNSSVGSCRTDDRDITEVAQKNYGWHYIDSRKQFDQLNNAKTPVKLPLMGLFAPTDLPYELDRRNMEDVYPSLDEMAQFALKTLQEATKYSDKGFFLMIEGSRIDHAGHCNDPAAQVHEVMAYDKAFFSVITFLDESDDQGVLIATSDHETGGLSTAKQLSAHYPQYLWHPKALDRATASAEHLAKQLSTHRISWPYETREELREYLQGLVQKGLGVTDVKDSELDKVIDEPIYAAWNLASIISARAQIGWSTHGHSAVDVNIYGTTGSGNLSGNHENIEVGIFLRDYLNVDVDQITKELVDASQLHNTTNGDTNWTGRIPSEEELAASMGY
ncbi:alkaline-phosphatase-like protein [Calycina marina]|uniref:Alkaline phosphatase n=1 Tax=Calycina marina TaxID=1763456 RepID=A0A9P7Z6H4_9HELO|nr:alkaline-phosphatase-like protein [Calycina marina]